MHQTVAMRIDHTLESKEPSMIRLFSFAMGAWAEHLPSGARAVRQELDNRRSLSVDFFLLRTSGETLTC